MLGEGGGGVAISESGQLSRGMVESGMEETDRR